MKISLKKNTEFCIEISKAEVTTNLYPLVIYIRLMKIKVKFIVDVVSSDIRMQCSSVLTSLWVVPVLQELL